MGSRMVKEILYKKLNRTKKEWVTCLCEREYWRVLKG